MKTFACASFVALAHSAVVWAVPPEMDVVVKSEFIFEIAPTPACHASTIVETQDGLVVAWFGGLYEKHSGVGIWTSRRETARWSEPVEVANGVQADGSRYASWNPV